MWLQESERCWILCDGSQLMWHCMCCHSGCSHSVMAHDWTDTTGAVTVSWLMTELTLQVLSQWLQSQCSGSYWTDTTVALTLAAGVVYQSSSALSSCSVFGLSARSVGVPHRRVSCVIWQSHIPSTTQGHPRMSNLNEEMASSQWKTSRTVTCPHAALQMGMEIKTRPQNSGPVGVRHGLPYQHTRELISARNT